jgi:uncharacterized protein
MVTIFLIHGTYGNPNENWFPWIKSQLKKIGCHVVTPTFPTPENQSLENWNEIFDKYQKEIDENTIFVGHSLGVAFILSILEKNNVQVRASFFVSGFIGDIGNTIFDRINHSFVNKKFNWIKIRKNCNQFYLFHSDNDPYVSLEKGRELAKNLETELNLVHNAGHFNKKSGYDEFNLLLDKIKKEL